MAKSKSKDEGFPYFKFAISKWNTGNIQQCSDTSKGVFMNLCALYWGQRGDLLLSKMLKRFPRRQKYFSELISEDVIKINGDAIEITFLDEQMTELGMVSEQNANNANKRWNQSKSDASASNPQCETDANAMPLEKKREEEIREEKSKKVKPHLFENSPFIDFEKFQKEFEDTDYVFCDLKIYYEKIKNWSAGGAKVKVDWIATARNFMIGDREKGKLILKPGMEGSNTGQVKGKIQTVLSQTEELQKYYASKQNNAR